MAAVFGALGKRPARHDPRTLRLARYLPDQLGPTPTTVRWDELVADWQVLANDKFGNCVPVAALHLAQNWTAHRGAEYVPTDDEAISAYQELNPDWDGTQNDTDSGVVMIDALKRWRREGLAGRRISAFVSCDVDEPVDVKQAIARFGGAFVGFDLPRSCRTQDVWSVPPGGPVGDGAKGSLGGHCVPVIAYTPNTLTCVTWGQLVPITWEFFRHYGDEVYAVLSPDWADPARPAPNGFKFAELQRDLDLL